MKLPRALLYTVLILGLCGAGTISVKTRDLKETTVTYKKKRERVFCYKGTPGTIKTSSGKTLFTSFAVQRSKVSRTRSKSKYDRLTALISLGKKECKRIGTPNPNPTPNPQTGNFDVNGNVTDAGRALFGIPAGLAANITTGRGIYQTNCTGCHAERTNYTFPVVREKIKLSPMLFDEAQIPDAQLAQIIAYLNRFRP